MKVSKVKRSVGIIVIGVILLIVGVPEVAPHIAPYGKMNCLTVEIDLCSGKVRHTKYYWFFAASQKISSDRAFTKALYSGDSPLRSESRWRECMRFDDVHKEKSPEYPYGDAIIQSGVLFDAATSGMDDKQKREIAEEIVRRWQASGDDSGVREYLQTMK